MAIRSAVQNETDTVSSAQTITISLMRETEFCDEFSPPDSPLNRMRESYKAIYSRQEWNYHLTHFDDEKKARQVRTSLIAAESPLLPCKLCKTDASFKQVNSAISSTLSYFGGLGL
uniref:Uncharacterized protein n=1 Tax=Romanomermis culicivorax TaxID=13658 RepID=A0A915K350_ROMCU